MPMGCSLLSAMRAPCTLFAPCQLTERGFQFPDCRARRMLEGAEGDQRNTVTAVAFGLKQIIAAVYRLRDCRFCACGSLAVGTTWLAVTRVQTGKPAAAS